jgi:UDP-N-acetylmuramate dehydrogenase
MKITRDEPLCNHCTFGIGGPASHFCSVAEFEELRAALAWAGEHRRPVFILGGGSNILFGDRGFDGLVIKLENLDLEFREEPVGADDCAEATLGCGAGVSLGAVVDFCAERGLSGLEWAAGIPGTVGGAVRGNAGAFGREIKDSLLRVRALEMNPPHAVAVMENGECEFGYRTSVFKKSKSRIVWDAAFRLYKGDHCRVREEIDSVLCVRSQKHPCLERFPSAGSVFMNPAANRELIELFEKAVRTECRGGKTPAGWLIDRCGLMGRRIGGAMVSQKQANFIVNTGGATAEDVVKLIQTIKREVYDAFQVELEEEIEIV